MNKLLFRSTITISWLVVLAGCNLPSGNAPTVIAPTPENGIVATTVASTLQTITQSALPSATQAASQTPLATSTVHTPTMTLTATITLIPSLTPTSSKTPLPSSTPVPDPGTIAGNISGYPYGSLPSLAIVAYSQNKPGTISYIITAPGTTNFSMTTQYLLPGDWQVVAYDHAGNSGGCAGLVTVISNQTVTCTLNDWASAFRSKDPRVPNP
jgi:hypothetical protein